MVRISKISLAALFFVNIVLFGTVLSLSSKLDVEKEKVSELMAEVVDRNEHIDWYFEKDSAKSKLLDYVSNGFVVSRDVMRDFRMYCYNPLQLSEKQKDMEKAVESVREIREEIKSIDERNRW